MLLRAGSIILQGFNKLPFPMTYKSKKTSSVQCDTWLQIRHHRDKYMDFKQQRRWIKEGKSRISNSGQNKDCYTFKTGWLKNSSHFGSFSFLHQRLGSSSAAHTVKLAANVNIRLSNTVSCKSLFPTGTLFCLSLIVAWAPQKTPDSKS